MINKKIHLRKCVGCNEMKEKQELIRVIKTPEGEIVLDTTGKRNGRGAYICMNPECLKLAQKNKGLERSLKQSVPETMFENLYKEMDIIGR